MNDEILRNIRLGLFVVITLMLLIAAMYFIGIKKNLFGSNFHISARFYNVNGLMAGNNVRFAGIDVGTVESITIINDSAVNVVMIIKEKVRPYIKKSSIVSIGTDGLMGNKLVNINSGTENSANVEDGDMLKTLRPIEMDEMIRTLNTTNKNVEEITTDFKKITQKISNSNSLWSLLMDTVVAENVKKAIVNIKLTSNRTATITGDLSSIITDMKAGKGSVGALLMDTGFSHKLNQTIVNVKIVSDKMAIVSGDLENITRKIKSGEGAIGTLIMDTSFVSNLNKSMENIKDGSKNFNDNMEALKQSSLLKGYFKKQEKLKK